MCIRDRDGGLPPDSVVQTIDEILRDSQAVVEKYHDSSRYSMHTVALAPCSPFSVTGGLLRESAVLALSLIHICNQETIKKSVSTAMGIAIISSAAVEDYVAQGQLLRFPLAEGDIYRKLYMVWSKSNKPGKAARLFIQFVRELYAYL